jgi:CDP-diacylglycerol--serine O-phosphatidyltransferase
MVSTIRFRSFKDLRLNARTAALVLFAVTSSAIVSLQTKPAFVLVWLLGFYVAIGLVETVVTFPRRRRETREAAATERPSLPPS